jgi:hypothetical protein
MDIDAGEPLGVVPAPEGGFLLLSPPRRVGLGGLLIKRDDLKVARERYPAEFKLPIDREPVPAVLTMTDVAKRLRVGAGAARRFVERNKLLVDVEGRARVLRDALDGVLTPTRRPTTSSQSASRTAPRVVASAGVFVLAPD